MNNDSSNNGFNNQNSTNEQQHDFNGGNQYQNPYGYQPGGAPYQGYYDESGLFSENKLSRKNGQSAMVKITDWLKLD